MLKLRWRREHDCDPIRFETPDQFKKLTHCLRVQRQRRLVHHNQLRALEQHFGDTQALPHAA